MQKNEDQKQEIANHRAALAKHVVDAASDDEILELMLLHKKLVFKEKYKNGGPPKWGDANLPYELKRLTAPLFLKYVYAELIVCGTVEKQTIRDFDTDLMTFVEQYIRIRTRRCQDLGDAAGLAFTTPPNRKRGRTVEAVRHPETGTQTEALKVNKSPILG